MANSKLETLSEIFNDKIFRIPDYQRGYSWGQEQLEDFWIDLSNLNDTRIHYTGMITVEHKHKNDYYHVIDGQQRLTSIMILLNCILSKFNDNDWIGDDITGSSKQDLVSKYLYKHTGKDGRTIRVVFGYEVDNPSDIYYRTKILSLENTENFGDTLDTLYTKNLEFAKKFYTKKIAHLEKGELEKLIFKITKQLKFNFYEIETDEGLDEFVIFETMNNRGKALTTLELLKNRLIYLTTLLDSSDDEINDLRTKINNVWKTVYEYLGKNYDKKIDDDDFLKYHWRMFFGKFDRAIANPERDFLLKEHFTIQNVLQQTRIKVDFDDINEYILNLQKAVVSYYYMLNPLESDYDEEIKIWLSKINRLGFDTFKPMLMAILIDKDNIRDDKSIVKVLKLVENYMFIKFRTMKGSNTTIKDFFELAYEYHKNKYIYRLLDKLESKVIQNHRNKLFKLNKFIEIILDEDKQGWYNWSGLSYVLYEYELHLESQKRGERKLEWEAINRESIEHVYPQNTIRECWDEFNQLDESVKNKIAHSLGNLVLLSTHHNSSIGNNCFEVKRDVFSTSSYSAIEISKYTDWTIENIIHRGEKILTFMSERWNIEFTDESKEKLLFNA